ncbi:hypothetical protein ACS0TY_036514 [Phlomoides rotata]
MENYGKHTTVVGPWGGQDGYYWDDGVHTTVRQIEISHGAAIDSIRIEYDLNGRSVWSEIHGGTGGIKIDRVRLEYPDEFLTSVHGYYGSLQEWGPIAIRSLTFHTNRTTYGPFGVEHGTYFTCPNLNGKIVGFLGKSGWHLDAIGVYVEPPITSNSIYSTHGGGLQNSEYSMIQGSLGTNYDLIVAVRQKDVTNTSPKFSLSPQFSHDLTKQPKIQEISSASPKEKESKIERVASKNVEGVVTSGPWGGTGGSLYDDGVYDGIRQINISRNVCIVSMRVCYDRNGQPVWGSKNGGTGSFKTDKIVLDYPSEVLTHLTGYYGPAMMMGPNVIKSLSFHTTKHKYGPYGEEHGEFFTTKIKKTPTVVGFHGRKGLFLDAIGVHVLEAKLAHNKNVVVPSLSNHTKNSPSPVSPSKLNNQTALVTRKTDHSEWPFKIGKQWQNNEVVHRLVKDPDPYGAGPWGGDGGKPWDDGVFTGIKQIVLTITDAICCIEIEYDRNGQSVWSVKHGGSGGPNANRVKLEYPNEVLTCISGYYGPIKKEQGTQVVQSLTFHTSRRKYGPFGEELGTYFASGTTEGKVVGLHGRSSMYLDAIGVHMQHWLGNKRSSKPPSLMKIFS